jgi:(p)ppGpp synthase/HD superfamily hydrolase
VVGHKGRGRPPVGNLTQLNGFLACQIPAGDDDCNADRDRCVQARVFLMSEDKSNPSILDERFDSALEFAARTHRVQTRKGSEVPYIGHLLGVCSLVIEDGGSEDKATAALLHDAVEDQADAR